MRFFEYLSQNQKDLIKEGKYLMDGIIRDHAYQFTDYSFLVFPFAKTYEGFLKKLFKERKFISHLDYISDHLRLGKLLSPKLINRLGDKSLYKKISQIDPALAENIWHTWVIGRNKIFHYFPHNVKAVSFTEAEEIITRILDTMEETFSKLKIQSSNVKTTT